MDVSTTEIAKDVFRISVFPPDSPITFGCFLIRDEQPAMIETGMMGMFDLYKGEVAKLIDPAALRYLIVPHFEMDECGSINRFLDLAPNAEAVCSPVGNIVTLTDYVSKPLKVVGNGETLSLGKKQLRFVVTPWVHYWDSMVVHDETDRVLFTSDLFMQPGNREPISSDDLSEDMVQFCQMTGLLPSQRHLEVALDRMEPLAVDTLACHHGSVLAGDPQRYYKALRTNVVADITETPFYDMKELPPGGF